MRPSSSSRSRRKSFCTSDRSSNSQETPSKTDRRALLEQWRKQALGKAVSNEAENKKRTRIYDAPPLPPSGSNTSFVAQENVGLSARERIRQRKLQKHLEDESPHAAGNSTPSVKSSIEYFDDEDEINTISNGMRRSIRARSPMMRRSLGGGALGGARRRSISLGTTRGSRGASPLMSLSQESEGMAAISAYLQICALTSPFSQYISLL